MEAGYQIPITALFLIGCMLAFTVVTTFMFRRQKPSADYYLAGRKVNSFINASAISSDYLSAASFLGVAGVAFLFGFDGIIYALGFFVGYIALLLFLASPLRKFGRYTVPDFVSERFHSKRARVLGVIGVLFVSLFYMAPQMLGAGKVMGLLLNLEYETSIIIIACIITFYVTVGGMKATTVNQLVQFWILFGAMFLLAVIPFIIKGYTYTDVGKFISEFKRIGHVDAAEGRDDEACEGQVDVCGPVCHTVLECLLGGSYFITAAVIGVCVVGHVAAADPSEWHTDDNRAVPVAPADVGRCFLVGDQTEI